LSRVIKTESAGKDRNRLSREIVLAMRELMRQSQPDENSRELAAFIAISLLEINNTIDASVAAWEKRGYWVKADRFRLEWEWSGPAGKKMSKAVLENDWATIAVSMAQIAQKLNDVQIPERNRLGTPWIGALQRLSAATKSQ
jgi:hypothetical protein